MNSKILIGVGVGIIIILFGIIVMLQSSISSPASPSDFANTPPNEPREEQATGFSEFNKPEEETSTPEPQAATPIPGSWYTQQGLTFRLPAGWTPETESPVATTITAQPDTATSITDLPRLQILIDTPTTDQSYSSPSQRYRDFQPDRTLANTNSRVSAGYRSPPLSGPAAAARPIQDVVVVLEKEDKVYTLLYQYAGTKQDEVAEQPFKSIIESLQYQ